MKYYTEPLVNDLKSKKKVSAFFLGDWRRTSYYQARHRDENIYLLWIEGSHFGKVICYPCAMEKDGELFVFESGNLSISQDNNAKLITAWENTVDPERIRNEFDVTEMEKKAFDPIFSRYRKDHLDRELAKVQAEEEEQLKKDAAEQEALPEQAEDREA